MYGWSYIFVSKHVILLEEIGDNNFRVCPRVYVCFHWVRLKCSKVEFALELSLK